MQSLSLILILLKVLICDDISIISIKASANPLLIISISISLLVSGLFCIIYYKYKKKETLSDDYFLEDKELCTQWLNNSSYYKYESNPIPFPKIDKKLLTKGHFLGIVK